MHLCTLVLSASSPSCQDPQVREFILQSNSTMMQALIDDDAKMTVAFHSIDTDRSGTIGIEEWRTFVQHMAEHRLVYLRKKLLVLGRCFWGRGMDPGEAHFDWAYKKLGLPRGLLDDFWFFAKVVKRACSRDFPRGARRERGAKRQAAVVAQA